MSSSLRYQLPHGLTDLFLEQAALKTELEGLLQATFRQWGYDRIIPPTFAYDEALATGASPQLQEAMYRFFDREGHILALRPDMTIPTARVVGTRLYDQPLPLRLYYIGNVFRHIEPQAGWRREFTQAGIELIGADTPAADAEVLAVTIAALLALNLSSFQINLGQIAFLQALLAELPPANDEADTALRRRLEQVLDRKNDVELQTALDELGITGHIARAIRALPHLCGDEGVLDEAERLTPNPAAREAVERLRQVYRLLCTQGVSEHIILDLGEMRGMAYYTGITFHGYVAGLGFPICGGGRYDHLMANFGPDLPAVGFALSIERAMLVTQRPVRIAPDVVMQACEHAACHALVTELRGHGLRVEVDVLGRRQADLIAYARTRGARYALCCQDAATFTLADATSTRSLDCTSLEKELATWTP